MLRDAIQLGVSQDWCMSCTVPTAHAQSRLSQRGSTLALSLSPGACALFLVYVRSTMYVAVMCEAVMFEAVMCEPALYVRLLTNYVSTCILVSLICTYVCLYVWNSSCPVGTHALWPATLEHVQKCAGGVSLSGAPAKGWRRSAYSLTS